MIYDTFADEIKREYELFLYALTGRYLALTGAGMEVSPHLINALRKSGLALQGMFVDHATTKVLEFAQEYASARSHERAVAFLGEIVRMSDANIATLIERLKGAALNPQTVPDMHGAMGLLLQRNMADPTYKVTTKSGRSYDAVKLMATEARDLGYRVWLDNQLEWIAVHGDLARVMMLDPTDERNGIVFSISGETSGYRSFAEIEQEIFHYNSLATVVPHVSV